MRSNDETKKPRKRSRAIEAEREGDVLEAIIDPAEPLKDDEPSPASPSAVDVVDDLLADDLGILSGETSDAEDAEDVEEPRGGVPADDALENIVRSQRTSKLRLGDILKEMGLVTDEQVESAIDRQKETRKRLGQLLLDDGVVTQLDLTKALAQKFGVSFLDLTATRFDGAATAYIDERLARRYGAVPVRFLDDNTLLVAMIDPQNLPAQEDLAIITGFPIQPAIASEEDVFGAIAKVYREKAEVGENADEVGLDDESVTDIRDATEEAPIVKLVNSVIAQSVDDSASDIHFEPQAKELMVRYRIDGVLHEIKATPAACRRPSSAA